MKKKFIMFVLALGLCMAAAGCKQKSEETHTSDAETNVTGEAETEDSKDKDSSENDLNENDSDGTSEEETDDTDSEKTTAELLEEIDLDKCVVLGEYKGITVEKTIQAVTDQDVQNEIELSLANYPVEVNRPAQLGDTVNIDYVGRLDGEEFEGGSDQGFDLKLGSGQFIDGFEDGLVGASASSTRVLNLTFSSEYSPELAGKNVEFTVTVNAVKAPLEEATDEWVAANIEGYYTVDEYKAGIRAEQEENNELTADEQVRYNAWNMVVAGCTIKEYPDPLVEMGKKLYVQQAEAYAQYAQMELEDFIENSGMTQEEFDASALEYGRNIAAQAMVNQAICSAEGFVIGDEEYQKALNELLAEYGCTESELIGAFGQDNVEQTIMMDRVSQLILDNANIIETVEQPSPTPDPTDGPASDISPADEAISRTD